MIEWVTWMHGIDDLDDLPSIHYLCMLVVIKVTMKVSDDQPRQWLSSRLHPLSVQIQVHSACR